MRILLTGMTGQLGTAVAETAETRGIGLVPLVRRNRRGRVPFERAFPAWAGSEVKGDVTAPLWGLTDAAVERLAGEVDAVLNLAGETNWAGTGRDLYTSNVLGARTGLDVARELQRRGGRPVLYCHASSIYVAGGAVGTVPEAPMPPDRHRTAYEHSKWLAERELWSLHRPGDPDLVVARVAALLGDSRTGATLRRNSLYLLAERWDELPGRLLPAMPRARVDVLPRDVAADVLLSVLESRHAAGPASEPTIVHVAAGESAPTLRSLLETARAASPLAFRDWARLVPARAEHLLWLSANAERFAKLPDAWRNSVIGLRYIGLDRVMERGALSALLPEPPPAVRTELLARLLFDLPSPARPRPVGDRGLARFQP
ncbi:SDR family oxidoreductase [Streptomyces sp. NPDC001770]